MSNDNTLIQIKRSSNSLENLLNQELKFGEPAFVNPNDNNKNQCLVIGNSGDEQDIENGTFFNGYTDRNLIDKSVFYNNENNIIDKDGNLLSTKKVSPTNLSFPISAEENKNDRYYLLSCKSETGSISQNVYTHDCNDYGIYITRNGVLNGGAWNDYAERRIITDELEPGTVVCENGDGTLGISKEKLQILPHVISDTAGMVIGGLNGTPIGIAGRVLVKVNCDVKLGDVLCADKDGYATKMTRNEVANYPDRILGIVSEIPNYDKWNNVEVNDRIWLTIK